MIKSMFPLVGAMMLLTAQPVFSVGAIGHAEAGKKKAEEVCVACHGVDGLGTNPQYPKLAGQHADYIVKALEDYANGKRTNAIMSGFAASLSKEDRANLAAWYSSQPNGVYTVSYDK